MIAWQESGDWRKAEEQVPLGVHPGPENSPLGEQIAFLEQQGLSMGKHAQTDYAWLPWWDPLRVRWVQGMGGEHEQWMAEEAQFLVDGAGDEFINLRLRNIQIDRTIVITVKIENDVCLLCNVQ